jgi:hypothetical protein
MSSAIDHHYFGCDVTNVTYDLLKNVGHVHMPAGNCTDMARTIKFFVEQIPSIGHIITWRDGNLDTQYVDHNGEWIAL